MAKRVRLGKGWRVYRKETGQLLPVLAGHIVKPGEICERDEKYFQNGRFLNFSLKKIYYAFDKFFPLFKRDKIMGEHLPFFKLCELPPAKAEGFPS